jgi:hypothetical protein
MLPRRSWFLLRVENHAPRALPAALPAWWVRCRIQVDRKCFRIASGTRSTRRGGKAALAQRAHTAVPPQPTLKVPPLRRALRIVHCSSPRGYNGCGLNISHRRQLLSPAHMPALCPICAALLGSSLLADCFDTGPAYARVTPHPTAPESSTYLHPPHARPTIFSLTPALRYSPTRPSLTTPFVSALARSLYY